MPSAPKRPKPNPANCAERKPFRVADFFSGLLMGRHWQREALLCALGAPALIRQVTTLCNDVERQLDRTFDEIVAMDAEAQAMAECCREEIRARIGHVRAGLKETETNPAAWVETFITKQTADAIVLK